MFPLPPRTEIQRSVVDRAAALAGERFAARAGQYDAASAFPSAPPRWSSSDLLQS